MRRFVGSILAFVVSGALLHVPITPLHAADIPVHRLAPDDWWALSPPKPGTRFDASGLVHWRQTTWLTVNDKEPVLYEIQLRPDHQAPMIPWTRGFTADDLRKLDPTSTPRYDLEGLALDDRGRVLVAEEIHRWILRWDPDTRELIRIQIDWQPVDRFFSKTDSNASFEGLAWGGNRLWVANERSRGRIFEIDLPKGVLRDFTRASTSLPAADVHYSDLAWHDGTLFALLRAVRRVIALDPVTLEPRFELDYASLEQSRQWRFANPFPTGYMEGLFLDDHHVWLVTDANGGPRVADPTDRRPLLFRCPRPDRLP